MIFVDSGIVIFAVGKPHPLREEARAFLRRSFEQSIRLVTSAEVLQELLHVYRRRNQLDRLDAALRQVEISIADVFPLEREDVLLACSLARTHSALSARDLIHLACCRRRAISHLQTFDRDLAAAFESG